MQKYLQVSFCFPTACSQIDAHFDPDSADNASSRIVHIMKQFPWYLGAFMLNGFSQFRNCCRFRGIHFVFKVAPNEKNQVM